jgi:hypothetical protein
MRKEGGLQGNNLCDVSITSFPPEIYIDHGDTGDQIVTGVNDDGGKLPPVSTPQASNWHRCQ